MFSLLVSAGVKQLELRQDQHRVFPYNEFSPGSPSLQVMMKHPGPLRDRQIWFSGVSAQLEDLQKRGQILYRAKQFQEALKCFNQVRATQKLSPSVLTNNGC